MKISQEIFRKESDSLEVQGQRRTKETFKGCDEWTNLCTSMSRCQWVLRIHPATGTSEGQVELDYGAELIECFCQLSAELKQGVAEWCHNNKTPDIFFLQSLKYNHSWRGCAAYWDSKFSITYIRPVETKQKWWLCHLHSSLIDWALVLHGGEGGAARIPSSGSESREADFKTSLCGL